MRSISQRRKEPQSRDRHGHTYLVTATIATTVKGRVQQTGVNWLDVPKETAGKETKGAVGGGLMSVPALS
jgi:hypothetical protein